MNSYEFAHTRIVETLRTEGTTNDIMHAINTLHWLTIMDSSASEIIRLAALGHDIERARANRLLMRGFTSYIEYKRAHARISGMMLNAIIAECGYADNDGDLIEYIVAHAEERSDDAMVQVVCDADSISFFDVNLAGYVKEKPGIVVAEKAQFMYDRSSDAARWHIRTLVQQHQMWQYLPEFS